jgi:hypothetical protein
MARQLAIVEIEGEKFFDDERLQEYRHVDKMHVIEYSAIGDRKVKVVQEAQELLPKKRNRNDSNGLHL